MAAAPPMPGIRRSIRMTSGRSVPTTAQRLGAVRRLADDLEVRVAGEHPAQAVADDRVVVDDEQPDRAHGAARRRRSRPRSPGPGPTPPSRRPAPIRSRASPRRGPPAGASRSARTRRRVPRAARARRPRSPTPSSRTSSVTTSPMYDRVSHGSGGAGVPGDVRERLLGRPQERDLDLRVEGDDLAGDGDLDRDAVELGPFARDVGERVRQRPRLEGRRASTPRPSGAPRSGSRGRAARRSRGGGRGPPAGRAPGRPPRAG